MIEQEAGLRCRACEMSAVQEGRRLERGIFFRRLAMGSMWSMVVETCTSCDGVDLSEARGDTRVALLFRVCNESQSSRAV
jgi:hypothetical protein